jgi:hypothetical protein
LDRAVPKSEQQAEQEEQQLLALQMDALYKAVPAAVLSIFAALMTLYTFWSPATAFGLSIWMVWMIAIASLHVSAAYARDKHLFRSWSDVSWSKMARFIYLNAGLSWGVGGAWLIGHGTDPQIFVMTCIVMGAVMVTFPHRRLPAGLQPVPGWRLACLCHRSGRHTDGIRPGPGDRVRPDGDFRIPDRLRHGQSGHRRHAALD